MTEVSSRATPRVKGKVSLRGAAPGVKQAPKRKAHDSELDDSDEDQADSEGSDDDDNQDEIDTDDMIAAAKQSGKSKKTASEYFVAKHTLILTRPRAQTSSHFSYNVRLHTGATFGERYN